MSDDKAKIVVGINYIFKFFNNYLRRVAGAVERGGLENRCTLMGTQGSNP